jgi:hypothetical protein
MDRLVYYRMVSSGTWEGNYFGYRMVGMIDMVGGRQAEQKLHAHGSFLYISSGSIFLYSL